MAIDILKVRTRLDRSHNIESVLSCLCVEAVLTVLLQFCNWPVGNLYETCNTKLRNCPLPWLLLNLSLLWPVEGGGAGVGSDGQ